VQLEALIFLEIDRCADAAELRALEASLQEVLEEVRLAVGDFEPMKAKAQELLGWLDKAKLKVDKDELEEIKVFLSWLVNNHFTFLGYEEFTVASDAGGDYIAYDE